jgi:hypothetical protein
MSITAVSSNRSMRTQLDEELRSIESERPLIDVSALGQLPACVGRVELLLLSQTHGAIKRAELGALSDSLLLGLLQDEQREVFGKELQLNRDLREKIRESGQLTNTSTFVNALTVAGSITAGALAGGPAGAVAVVAGLFNAGRLVAENTGVYRRAAKSLCSTAASQREMELTLATGAKWLGTGLSVGTAFCGGWAGLRDLSSSLFEQTSRYGTVIGSTVQSYLGFKQARVSSAQSHLQGDRVDLRGEHSQRDLEVEETYNSLNAHLAAERKTFEMLSQVQQSIRELDYQVMQGV